MTDSHQLARAVIKPESETSGAASESTHESKLSNSPAPKHMEAMDDLKINLSDGARAMVVQVMEPLTASDEKVGRKPCWPDYSSSTELASAITTVQNREAMPRFSVVFSPSPLPIPHSNILEPRHTLPQLSNPFLPLPSHRAAAGQIPGHEYQNEKRAVQSGNLLNSSEDCPFSRSHSFLHSEPHSHMSCSHNFCDWVWPGNLDRCFDLDGYDEQGNAVYFNKTPNDYKLHAPMECRLCLPKVDCIGIEEHCRKQEYGELISVIVLLTLLGVSFLVALFTILVKQYLVKKRAKKQAFDEERKPMAEVNQFDGAGHSTEFAMYSRYISDMVPGPLQRTLDRRLFVRKAARDARAELVRNLEQGQAERKLVVVRKWKSNPT